MSINTAANTMLARTRRNPNGRVIALDIDLTSALGNDTNDILRIVALMTLNFSLQGVHRKLMKLLSLLINPRLFEAIQAIAARTETQPFIVFYTQKGGIVNLCDDAEGVCKDGTLHFRAGRLKQGPDYLFQQLQTTSSAEIYVHLRRVGILTWFVSRCLGLSYAAPVYITRTHKNVRVIGEHLNIDPAKIFLFDDNARHHAAALELPDCASANMIEVQPFDFHSMGHERRLLLYNVLQTKFPITADLKKQCSELFCHTQEETPHHTPSVDEKGWRDLTQIKGARDAPWDVSLVCVFTPYTHAQNEDMFFTDNKVYKL